MVKMKTLITMVLIIGTIFIMEYDGYYFDPCSGNMCLSIEGYHVPAKTIFYGSIGEIEEHLNKTGMDHLEGIYEIRYNPQSATIRKVNIKYRATIE